MKIKKIVAVLLSVLLSFSCFSLFACDDEETPQAEVYSITYDLVGGELPETAITSYTLSETNITLPVPTKAGYTFLGWFEIGKTEIVTVISAGSTGNKSFVAVWRSPFEVVINNETSQDFTAWADNSTGNKTVYVSSGDKLTIPKIKWDEFSDKEKKDSKYRFKGWFYKDKNNEERKLDSGVEFTLENLNVDSTNITIYAKVTIQWIDIKG